MKTYSIHIEFIDYENQEVGTFGFGGITAPLDEVLKQVAEDVKTIEEKVGEVVSITIDFEYEVEGGD
jgi:hypothetical protein